MVHASMAVCNDPEPERVSLFRQNNTLDISNPSNHVTTVLAPSVRKKNPIVAYCILVRQALNQSSSTLNCRFNCRIRQVGLNFFYIHFAAQPITIHLLYLYPTTHTGFIRQPRKSINRYRARHCNTRTVHTMAL